jgi:hypothetical protein
MALPGSGSPPGAGAKVGWRCRRKRLPVGWWPWPTVSMAHRAPLPAVISAHRAAGHSFDRKHTLVAETWFGISRSKAKSHTKRP